MWPADPRARALARSISAEMHSGFAALRTFLPMDFTARFGPPGRLLTPVAADIEPDRRDLDRVPARATARAGPFLFGAFTIADAMFAPVCSRFTTYAVPLDPLAQAYVDAHDGPAGDAGVGSGRRRRGRRPPRDRGADRARRAGRSASPAAFAADEAPERPTPAAARTAAEAGAGRRRIAPNGAPGLTPEPGAPVRRAGPADPAAAAHRPRRRRQPLPTAASRRRQRRAAERAAPRAARDPVDDHGQAHRGRNSATTLT